MQSGLLNPNPRSCISRSTSQSPSSLQLHRRYHLPVCISPIPPWVALSARNLYTLPSDGPSLMQHLRKQWLDKHQENHLRTRWVQVEPYARPERNTRSVAFGQKMAHCLQSAQANAPLTRMTAAAKRFSLTSLILFLRSQNFKSLLKIVATSVIFTPNITVNWTSLNSTGELPNLVIVKQEEQQPLMIWKRRY